MDLTRHLWRALISLLPATTVPALAQLKVEDWARLK